MRTAAIAALLLGLSVLGITPANAAGNRTSRQVYGTSGGGLDQAVADTLYLKLDASNGPLTGDLTFDGTISSSVSSGTNAVEFLTNGARLDFGIGATDYLFSDGASVNAAGGFVVLGALTVLGTNISAGTTDIRVNLFNSGGASVKIADGLELQGDIFDSRASSPVTVSDVDGLDVAAGQFSVSGISTLTGQLLANGGIKLLANRDITCASSNCEFGTPTFPIFKIFSNQLLVDNIFAETVGAPVKMQEPDGFELTSGPLLIPVGQYIFIAETTTPTAVPDSISLYSKSDNNLYFQSGDGVEHTVTVFEAFHAEATDTDNTDAFGVSAALNFECYHTSGFAAGDVQGFTFDAGGAGTSFPIASIADGGSGEIAVTTTGAHGLAVGDIVSQANLTDATYEGVFVVNTINSSTIYEVTAVFTATDTGTLNQCASLVAATGSAGDYLVTWTASATGVTNNETFDLEMFVQAGGDNTTVRERLGMAGLFSNLHNSVIITIADGDHLSLGIENQDSAGDIIIRQLTIVMTRL